MDRKKRALFSKLTFENWKNLILVALVCFYLVYLIGFIGFGSFGGDYLAFWVVGKIADEKGYSQIYDLNNLRSVEIRELGNLRLITKIDVSSITTNPVPYFSFFVIPFHLLSRVNIVHSYWIWTFLNLIILIGYLIFFLQKIHPEIGTTVNYLNLLILMLISFPVFSNIILGQVEVLLVVFAGEFIRYAVTKKPVLSGIWLGGLMLKPQLLILVIPIFLIMRNWKVLFGFIVSSGTILMVSLLLSGLAGMKALINLLTKYSVGMASNFLEGMINWRMIGLNLNNLFNTWFGWVITGLGMVLTIVAVYFLIRQRPPFGSPQWVMAILGVFSATLAITWHSHYHMAMVIIPFLIYASLYKQLPETIIFLWGIVTSIAFLGKLITDLLAIVLMKINTTGYAGMIFGFFGFILNLVILISTIKSSSTCNLVQD